MRLHSVITYTSNTHTKTHTHTHYTRTISTLPWNGTICGVCGSRCAPSCVASAIANRLLRFVL
jgi:hypothetical protein